MLPTVTDDSGVEFGVQRIAPPDSTVATFLPAVRVQKERTVSAVGARNHCPRGGPAMTHEVNHNFLA
jgi:hypothetical protein